MRRRIAMICSLVLGVVFVISGLLKLLDPVGTGFIMEEYMKFFGVDFLRGAAVPAGIFMSALELVAGGLMAIRFRPVIVSVVTLVMMTFYSLLTLVLMIADPPMDCGCFGEAVHLTHTQTFLKNLVLMLLSVPPFVNRRTIAASVPLWRNAYRIAMLAVMTVLTPLMSLLYRPFIDFTDFRPSAVISVESERVPDFSGTISFIYEKDGVRKEFMLDNLPDSTWTYVEQVATDLPSDMVQTDLPLADSYGNYPGAAVYPEGGLFLMSVPYPERLSDADWTRAAQFMQTASDAGIPSAVAVASQYGEYDYVTALTGAPVYYSDFKTLVTLNRSNGGVTYLYTDSSTTIIEKWSFRSMDMIDVRKVASSDADFMLMHATLRRTAFFQLLLLIYMIIMVL